MKKNTSSIENAFNQEEYKLNSSNLLNDTNQISKSETENHCCDNSECVSYVKLLESENEELKRYAAKAETKKGELLKLGKLRRLLAWFIFTIITIWLVAVFVLVFYGSLNVAYFSGKCLPHETGHFFVVKGFQVISENCHFVMANKVLNLSKEIVITLITTTTANVLGLSYIVARWLYPGAKISMKNHNSKQKN